MKIVVSSPARSSESFRDRICFVFLFIHFFFLFPGFGFRFVGAHGVGVARGGQQKVRSDANPTPKRSHTYAIWVAVKELKLSY